MLQSTGFARLEDPKKRGPGGGEPSRQNKLRAAPGFGMPGEGNRGKGTVGRLRKPEGTGGGEV